MDKPPVFQEEVVRPFYNAYRPFYTSEAEGFRVFGFRVFGS